MNPAIRRWKDELGRSPILSPESVAELESHLRDSVATLEEKGLSTEEAFLIAARRIGPPGNLEAEFAKVTPPPPTPYISMWPYLGAAVLVLVLTFLFVTFWPITVSGIDGDFQAPPPGVPSPVK